MITRVSDATVLYANLSLAQQMRTTVDALVGQNVVSLYPDPQSRQEMLATLMEHGELKDYRLEIVSPNGQRFFTRSHLKLVDHEGEAIILSSHQDVTKEEQREEELRQLNRNYKAILNSSVEPLLITRIADGKVLYANQQMAGLMKTSISELLEQFAPSFYRNAGDRQLLLHSVKHGWSISQTRVELLNRDAEVVVVRASAQAIEFSGEPALVASFRDITKKEALERKLEETLELQALANRSIGISYWTWDIQKNELQWDPFGYELFEIDLDTPDLFPAFMERIDERDLPQVQQTIQESLQVAMNAVVPTDHKGRYEFRMNLPSGATKVIRSDFQIRLLNGQMMMLGTSQDVSEEVQLRNAYLERLGHIELLTTHAGVGFWLQGEERTAWWDEGLKQMYQVGPEEQTDFQAIVARLHPMSREEQLQRLEADNQKALQGQSVKSLFHLCLPDRSEIFVDHFVQAKEIGGVRRLIGVAINVTEREQQLAQISENYELMLLSNHAAKIGYWTRDLQLDLLHHDDYCKELLELPTWSPTSLLKERLKPASLPLLEQVREETKAQGYGVVEFELELPSGKRRFVRSHQRFVNFRGKKQVVGLSQDITAEVEQREALQRQERFAALGQLAAEINHDLKQPLSIIDLRLFQLHELLDATQREKGQRALKAAQAALNHAKSIIARTLSSTRSEDERDPQPLSSIITQVADLFSTTFRHQEIQWSFRNPWEECPDEEPLLYLNRAHLIQVLQNLLANAVDAIEERRRSGTLDDGGVICAALSETEDSVQLELQDSGMGISAENQNKVFDQFFTTKGEQGTGLGLSMCLRVLMEHQGSLTVQDREDGKPGASFRLTLPKPILTPVPASDT